MIGLLVIALVTPFSTHHFLQRIPADSQSKGEIMNPSTTAKVAAAVAAGNHERGILLCGTGIGMCIAATTVPGAYAALCAAPYSTERSRQSNTANIMTLGAQVLGAELVKTLVSVWMGPEYTPGGRSEPKIQRIQEYAEEHSVK